MSRCLVAVGVLWLFLPVPWDGMQCVIVVFPDHTHFFLAGTESLIYNSICPLKNIFIINVLAS